MAQYIRILPESMREPSALPGQTCDFVIPSSSLMLQGGSAHLEFSLSVGKGLNGFTGLTYADIVSLSEYCGAWSVIKSITISSDRKGTISQLKDVGRTMATLYAAKYADGSLEMSSRRGCLELCCHSVGLAIRALMSTSGTVAGAATSYAEAAQNGTRVALDLSFTGLGLLSQNIPLSETNGLRVTVQFAQAAEALYSQSGTVPTFFISDAALSASVFPLSTPNPASAIQWLELLTLRSQIDTNRKTISFNSVPTSNALGFVMSINPSNQLNSATGNEYNLALPPNLSELSFQLAGYNQPLSFLMMPLNPALYSEDDVEVLDVVTSLFGSQITRYGCPMLDNSMTVTSAQLPTWFMAGTKFDQPQNLFQTPLSITMVSAITAAAPMAAFVVVVSQNSLAL